MITGSANYDDAPLMPCKICGGYYKADEPELHHCEGRKVKKNNRAPYGHNLKIWPRFFSAVCSGAKRAELRKNDRDYRNGDTLNLCEWDQESESFTGEFVKVTITDVAELEGIAPGYVLLSIELENKPKTKIVVPDEVTESRVIKAITEAGCKPIAICPRCNRELDLSRNPNGEH